MILRKPPISTRNKFGPRADRLLVGYAVDEAAGFTLTNLGLSSSYNTHISIPHAHTDHFDGTILAEGDIEDESRWFTNTNEGSYVYLKSKQSVGTQQYVRVLNNASGNEIISLRGTMMMRFSISSFNVDDDQHLFNSGGTVDSKGNRLIVFRDHVTGKLCVYLSESTISGTDYQTRLTFNDVVVANQIYTLVWTWGEAGFNAWLDGVEADLIQLPGPIDISGYESDFEAYSGSTSGTSVTGQDGWYLPDITTGARDSITGKVYTYASNNLDVSTNPLGGLQFEGGLATNVGLVRAQHSVDFSAGGVWRAEWDCTGRWSHLTGPATDNIGSWSLQPSSTSKYFQMLMNWGGGRNNYQGTLSPPTNHLADFQQFHIHWGYFTESSPNVIAFAVPGPEWLDLNENEWYRISVTWNFDTAQILSVSIRNITNNGTISTTDVSGLGWYLQGGPDSSLPLPTDVRLFTGGDGDIAAWDNLSLSRLEYDLIDPRSTGGRLTNTYWSVSNGSPIRIGRDEGEIYADMRLYSFAWWDVQLKDVERAELFCDSYIPFRPKAADYSNSIQLFRTYNNPIPVRPRLVTSGARGRSYDEITFSAVTSTSVSSSYPAYMRIQYDVDPYMQSPTTSSVIIDSNPNHQMNLSISTLTTATTYYYIAEYSADGTYWYAFPGGRGKFKTQKRVNSNFDYAFWTDDHICDAALGGPPLESRDVGYGGDILNYANTVGVADKWYLAWRSMYDLYVNQDVDFIVIGGDYYFGANTTLYDGDTNPYDNPEKMAETYRNWCNLLFKCGCTFFVQGNNENEAGYFQREFGSSQDSNIQLRCTIARKKFFPNPTNTTYPEGGEYETPTYGSEDWIPQSGNDWIPQIDTSSSSSGTQTSPGTSQVTYDQEYRNAYILGTNEDPYASIDLYQLNRSPLENYFAWTWGGTLFIVLDVYRYTEPGDPLNTGGSVNRSGPVWTLGTTQKTWMNTVLTNSYEQSKFIFAHSMIGGEGIGLGGDLDNWYGRGSGALVKKVVGIEGLNSYDVGQLYDESVDEIDVHNLMKQYQVTAYVKGHDHKFCHLVNDEVNYITCSSPSAPDQLESTGIRNSYGHTEDQDTPTPSAAAFGIKMTSNTRGYCIFRFTSNSWKCINRHCAMSPQNISGYALANRDYSSVIFGGTTNPSGPAWAGPLYVPDSSDQITLSETPWQIYTICSPDDGVFSGANNEAGIWDSAGVDNSANLYISQDDVWEEFYGDNIITLNSSTLDVNTSGELQVMHVPQTSYTSTLLNAINEDQSKPSIHNINPDNVIFVYNINVDGSESVAHYYREKRHIPASNLIGLDMPITNPPASCETPISKNEFETTILEPLRDIVASISDSQIGASGSALDSSVIILGYGTPLSYTEDDGEIIAIASRLHRLNFDYESKRPNHTYDRRNFKFYDVDDSQQVFITAIIDGPTPEAAMKLIDRGVSISNQPIITGKLMVDPYGLRLTSQQREYENDILYFVNNYAQNLGLTINTTTEIESEDPYVEPTFAIFSEESFYWGWFEPTFSKDLFTSQNQKRVFLYNADDDSACQIHYYESGSPFQPDGSDPWCNLAINIDPGYASCAGSIDPPGVDALLRPRPFFTALQQGATIGEAFLFSSPFVNWKIVLIGDPLTTVIFPADIPPEEDQNNTTLPNNEVIRRMKESIEESLGWGARQARYTTWIREFNVDSNSISEEIQMLYATSKWETRKKIQIFNDLLNRAAQSFLLYIHSTTGLTFPQWLVREGEKVSILFNDLLKQLGRGSVQDEDTEDLVYTEGHWDYEFTYTHDRQTFENLNFELQLSIDDGFTGIVIDLATATSVVGWEYEFEPYQFTQLASGGFPSNFSGRRLKFTTPVTPATYLLTRTDVFHVRWRAMEADGVTPVTEWIVDNKLLIIKR